MTDRPTDRTADPKAFAVPAAKLRRHIDPAVLSFSTTAELEPVTGLAGQDRALSALRFGAGIDQPSFNLFAVGEPGAGTITVVRSFLEDRAGQQDTPSDWVYVNNFKTPHEPHAIALPRGRAPQLSQAMVGIVDELRAAIPAMFDGEDYRSRRRAIDEQMSGTQEHAFEDLKKHADAQSISILRTPMGFALAPSKDGKVLKPEQFNALPEDERQAIQKEIETLQEELGSILERMPLLEKGHRKKIRELNEELAEIAVRQALSEPGEAFADLPEIANHLIDVQKDLISNVALFLADGADASDVVAQTSDSAHDERFRPYMVNTIVSTEGQEPGAPVLEEDNPTLGNLVGRVEHLSQMGTLVTDFLLIKPGALHKANGGYLLLDAREVLMQPFAWEALKRALKAQEIAIESPAEQYSLVSTVSLAPDRIPLALKTILFGDRYLYYMLSALDPDFSQLFKVVVDFNDAMDHTGANIETYARLVASIVDMHKLKPVDAAGVARLIEEGARLADDSEKLTLHMGKLTNILHEANYWADYRADGAGRDVIGAEDVTRAVNERIFRSDRIRTLAHEAITRNIMLIDTDGAVVGQVNGLSVSMLGNFSFGRPSRITARARMGAGKLIDIEREVELGGPLHSKGVMILRGFLEGRYAHNVPLSLSASLVFEQSYGGVDGDSASSAELYALLSALADVPLKQSIAVTGSVNQHGQVQAIGGVNEKIEGFFDICKPRGLTGDQGVVIPKSNIVHLMLRDDVTQAVEDGLFHVYAVDTIDQGIEVLTGLEAGERGPDGAFPEGSLNARVEDRLIAFAEARRAFAARAKDGKADEADA